MQFMLLFSRQGKLRLQKWYTAHPDKTKKKITRELVTTILTRKPKMCSFLEWRDLKVVYKRYASLYFCCAIEQTDNELLTLEIIHRYVELLDKYFGSVCELDIIFNFEKAYFILDELLLGGEVQETSKKTVLKAIAAQDLLQEDIHEAAGGLLPRLLSTAANVGSSASSLPPLSSAAANFAWVNRSSMTFLTRQAFGKMFNSTPDDLDMQVIYDVSHNIAKVEEHLVDGKLKTLLVHRKGSTRAFPPHHPLIPVDYQLTGQPVLIGGTMGTCSYVLTGTEEGMKTTFGSTCHGAGRALSRAKSRRALDYTEVLGKLAEKNISIRVASPKLVMEEAPESYKNVTDVVNTCHAAKISKKCVKLRPIAVIKG